MDTIEDAIRNVADFPKPGIQFKDISPLLADKVLFRETIDALKALHQKQTIDVVVGIEARGFIFAAALAYALNAGTCMVRKPGKLPFSKYQETYQLEYGSDTVEIHTDAFTPGQNILVIDDVLATGGTIAAALKLIQTNFSVEIIAVDFLMELTFLGGREKLDGQSVNALIHY